ncbi:cytochrome P450 monooxygenase-like protein [Viridothelium virens]|uniref:Cytochrome P450 monooxygenase-like protein n=1 Tax=Viridothelium virens TaxID=1048519 RepID=A0A6A6GY18_VIRVR|nr:cytochrome P450 monooxygenase-like protein [Viridothelium virens]
MPNISVFQFGSSFSWTHFSITVLGSVFLCLVSLAVYNVYLHPLAKFPGPRLWTASSIPYFRALLSGNFATTINDIHARYGPVVRVAPDELSYIDEEAWRAIYGYHSGGCFPKSLKWFQPRGNGEVGIFAASAKDHGRFRRAFAPAFTKKMLHEHEPLIMATTNLFIEKLASKTVKKRLVDICEWMEYAIFDFAGEFAFSRSFRCLEREDNRFAIQMVQSSVHAFARVVPARAFGLLWLWKLVNARDPQWANRVKFEKTVREYTQERLQNGELSRTGKEDLVTWICRRTGKGGELSKGEVANALADFLVAGTETVASVVIATVHHLFKNPGVKAKLENEIRSAFGADAEITAKTLSDLPYLNACINETMRIAPTLPNVLPRIVPNKGTQLCGEWIPGGTFVSFSQFAAYHSSRNFSSPESYLPARWIDPVKMETHNSDVFNPFSTGPRSCVGEEFAWTEVRLFLAKLLFNFDLVRQISQFEWEDQEAYFIYKKKPMVIEIKERRASK